jgi:hypothetical protein
MNTRTKVLAAAGAVAVVLLVAQLLPLGPDRTQDGAPVAIAWPDEETRALAERACTDCHSPNTDWPWYASIAPASWIVADHVAEGRAMLDFSLPGGGSEEAQEAGESIREGEMPPGYYTFLHPAARLSRAEKATLAAGLDRMFGGGEGEDLAAAGDEEEEKEELEDDD